MNTNTKCKQWRMPFLLILFTLFFCWLFCGRYGVFGSKVDWISQHSVFPDYFRQQFYAAIKQESGSWKWALFAACYTTVLAWLVSFAVYQIGGLFV